MTDGWPATGSPFHEGEIAYQEKVGVRETIERQGRRIVRDHMPEEHRDFFAQLPSFILGTVDALGRPWASILAGSPGFLSTPDDHTLHIGACPVPGDPVADGLTPGAPVGGLGLEFHTRRRNRINGRLKALDGTSVTLAVDQTFGNCPQYIFSREAAFRPSRTPGPAQTLAVLDQNAKDLIDRADTLFIATVAPAGEDPTVRGADVSHRGGKAGFVRVDADGILLIPDFIGNFHFNTIGNLVINPKAGVVIPDVQTGDLLSMTGEAVVVDDDPLVAAFRGAERLIRFKPEEIVRLPSALPLIWAGGTASPNSLLTGSWEEAEATLAAEADRNRWRPFRIARIEDESEGIKSFYLTPADNGGLVRHEAGQYLPISAEIDPGKAPVTRTYTLSVAPSDGCYRISVKRDGAMSRYLHDKAGIGDVVQALPPRGVFTINAAEKRPAVLLSAGVGITPMVAMLRHLGLEGARTRSVRPAYFIHGAHSSAARAFFNEVTQFTSNSDAFQAIWALSTVMDTDKRGFHVHAQGRITVDLLKAVLPFDDYDFYLCGPPGFMQDLYDGLRDLNVADARIHAESFGPAALMRRPDAAAEASLALPPAEEAEVVFQASGKTATWQSENGNLLDFAEAQGLAPSFGCRAGACGTCHTRIIEGEVTYPLAPASPPPDGEVLTCCAVPASPRVVLDV